jgi:uncharacterized protein
MEMMEKQAGLRDIYRSFEEQSREFRQEAVCRTGCAFCCTRVGSVDITTLEGLAILENIAGLARPVRKQVARLLEKNRRQKEKKEITRCPFLLKNNTCRSYEDRPFSCRQLYSLEKCGPKGPTVHRQVVDMARRAVEKLQRLDDTGYSGHISHILAMLDAPRFRRTYLSGGFNPAEIMDFGKAHGIVINRMARKTV